MRTTVPAQHGLGRSPKQILLVTLIVLVPFAFLTYRFNWLCDDAYISFRYAKHLAEGHGLRYNVGEDPPVEGYSNFLWVLVLAALEAIGWGAPVCSCVISVACGVVLLWRIVRLLNRSFGLRSALLTLSALFFVTLPPVAIWATSGLATLPQTLVLFLAFERLLGDRDRLGGLSGGIACAVLILIRADGFVWVLGLVGLAALGAMVRRDRAAVGPLVLCAVITVVAFGGLIGFRLAYFEWPLPNTYYAKVGFSGMTLERGGDYLLSMLFVLPHLVPILIAGAVVAWRDRNDGLICCHAVLLTLWTFAYVVAVGGDFMAMGRLVVPALPFVAILFGALVARLSSQPVVAVGCGLAAVALSLLPAWNVHVVPSDVREKHRFRWGKRELVSEYEQWESMRANAKRWTLLGRALRQHCKPDESVVTGAIGAAGYYSDLVMYDPHGLVSPEVAHRKAPRRRATAGHDKGVPHAYFLKYRPTYFIPVVCEARSKLPAQARGNGYVLSKMPGVYRNVAPQIKARYVPVAFPLEPTDGAGPGKLLVVLKRKDRVRDRS